MSEQRLPLRGIAVFEAAARFSSFQAAADELDLTPSAVSHQIRLLEEILGVKLFDRVGRGVILTTDGAEYARSVRQSIRGLRAATRDIKTRGHKGDTLEVVRIEAPPSLAHCWLLPRLPDLMTKLPGVDIRVNAQGSHLQGDRLPFPLLADAPADVQIVYGDKDIWEDRASLLLSEDFAPYCAPAFLAQHPLDEPEHLPRLNLISTNQNAISWDEWLNTHGVDLDGPRISTVQLDPSHLAIEAAVSGLGVILESNALVSGELAAGALVSPFPDLNRPGLSYWIYAPAANRVRPIVDAAIGWLKDMASMEFPS
ncbi:MAG TPA: LysR substrate-binding domain-containing protein [Caulobacteraceae bacterium]|nr:LysR substrate-binding domain-containing protein [Caulobacteraceae bacterium]